MPRSLSDLTSAQAVQAALDEYFLVGRDAFLERYGYGRSRSYLVVDPRTGLEADSKAIAGVALGKQYPDSGPLKSSDFSGGDATVAPRLQALGFVVRHAGARQAAEDWAIDEVELIVADYLAMLTLELTGQRYSKSFHRERLASQLIRRTEASIEFKHCNISAVMLELGFPYLTGYKPRVNFQRRLLSEVVSRQVGQHRVLDEAAMAAATRPVDRAEGANFSQLKVEAPRPVTATRDAAQGAPGTPIKRDYLERESRNRSLGRAGEDFAVQFERWRLIELGAGQLADRVEHVSETRGDGLGYDVLSFESDGTERFIEVKTTAFGERTPFFVSANEMRFARTEPERFRLYRLFDFRAAPRLFELPGPIEQHCMLDPTTYRASFG